MSPTAPDALPTDVGPVPTSDPLGAGGLGGHPRGLTTLFFTEMWERFSFYGMRALLMLFMVKAAAEGGLGYDTKRAAAIYGTYTMSVYLLSILGGFIAEYYGYQTEFLMASGFILCGLVLLLMTNVEKVPGDDEGPRIVKCD